MASILQVLHRQEAATYEQEAAPQAEWAATELERFFRRSHEQVAATLVEAERADAERKRAGGELTRIAWRRDHQRNRAT